MRRLLIAAALLLQGPALAHHGTGHGRQVTATVYASWYDGRLTACGQTFRWWGVSAAHPWLPCGTWLTVRRGQRSLVVPITDRCACDSIDLSAGAASRLGVPLDGVATVTISHR